MMSLSPKTRGVMCAAGGMINNAFGRLSYGMVVLLLVSMVEDLGCSYTEAMFVFTIASISGIAVSPFLGSLVVRHNPKYFYIFGGLGICAMLVVMAIASGLWMVLAAAVLFGVASKCTATLMYECLVVSWFKVGRGTITTLGQIVSGVIDATGIALFGICIVEFGWRQAAIGGGALIACVICLSAVFLVCRVPSAYGMEPIEFNYKLPWQKDVKDNERIALETTDLYEFAMPIKRLLREPLFYTLMSCPMLIIVAGSMFYTNATSIYTAMGLSTMQISQCISMFSIFGMILVPLYGVLSDLFGAKKIIIAFCSLAALSMFSFSITSGWGMVGALILAMFYEVNAIAHYFGAVVLTPIFGVGKAATLIGWCNVATGVGNAIAGPLCAALFESSGSYVLPLAFAGCCYAFVATASAIGLSGWAKGHFRKIDEPYRKDLPERQG